MGPIHPIGLGITLSWLVIVAAWGVLIVLWADWLGKRK